MLTARKGNKKLPRLSHDDYEYEDDDYEEEEVPKPKKAKPKKTSQNKGSVGKAAGAVGRVAARGVSGATKETVKDISSRVVAPAMSALKLEQLPVLNSALGSVFNTFRDIKDAYDDSKSSTDLRAIEDDTSDISEGIEELVDDMDGLGDVIYESVFEAINDSVGQLLTGIVTGASEAFNEIGANPSDLFHAVTESIQDTIDSVADNVHEVSETITLKSNEMIEAIEGVEAGLDDIIIALTSEDDAERKRKREEALERRVGALPNEGLKDKLKGDHNFTKKLEDLLLLTNLKSAFGLVAGVIGGIVGFLSGPVLLAVKGIGLAIGAIMSPVGLVIAAIGAAVAGLTYVAHKLGDGDIIEGFKIMASNVVEFLKSIPEAVINFVKGIPGEIDKLFKDPLKTVRSWGSSIANAITSPFKSIADFFSEEISAVNSFLDNLGVYDFFKPVGEVFTWVKDQSTAFLETVQGGWNAFTGAMQSTIDFLSQIPQKIADYASDKLSWLGLRSSGMGPLGTSLQALSAVNEASEKAKAAQSSSEEKPYFDKFFSEMFKNDNSQAEALNETLAANNTALVDSIKLISSQDANERQVKFLKDELQRARNEIGFEKAKNFVSSVVNSVQNSTSLVQSFIANGNAKRDTRPEFGY